MDRDPRGETILDNLDKTLREKKKRGKDNNSPYCIHVIGYLRETSRWNNVFHEYKFPWFRTEEEEEKKKMVKRLLLKLFNLYSRHYRDWRFALSSKVTGCKVTCWQATYYVDTTSLSNYFRSNDDKLGLVSLQCHDQMSRIFFIRFVSFFSFSYVKIIFKWFSVPFFV